MTPNLSTCEMAAKIGYDIVVFDLEHGPIGLQEAELLTAACKSLGLSVYSRVESGERVPIQRALDAGADAIIVPQIRGVEDARAAASYAKYPPLGRRGLGHSRVNDYTGFGDDFVERENKRTKCILMVETQEAFDAIENIAALPAVDGVFIGPGDLSLTRGRGINRDTPADMADHRRVAGAAGAAGKPWSISAGGAARRRLAQELGADFITITDDLSAMYAGLAASLEATRKG
jgi:2-keto-3-deoxy-L-rhamnonate aldolase RhmA